MKHLTITLLTLLMSMGVMAEFSDEQNEILDRHFERIKDKLPLIMDSWDPPNNEPKCVEFIINSVAEKMPSDLQKRTKLSSWNLREKHNDYCGGDPYTAPNITDIYFFQFKGEERMSFDKWCYTDEGMGKELMPIGILVDDSFKGGCPEYVEGFSHLTGKWINKP